MNLRFFLLSGLLSLSLNTRGYAASKDSLRIATYNLANYTAADRLTDDGYRKNYPKPEVAKKALHGVFEEMQADIVALQEMGSAPYLEELKTDLKAKGMDYPYSLLVEGGDETRHLALLSKLPILRSNCFVHLDFPYLGGKERVKRGLLEAVFKTEAGDLTLWVLHLKSRFTEREDDPESNLRRAAEATAIRDVILRRHEGADAPLFCILGDFNDGKNRRPLKAMQARGNTPIASLLEARDSRNECWTHYYLRNESYERFDHILLSPAARRLTRPAFGPEGPPARIIDTEGGAEASDHRPVLVELAIRPLTEGNALN